MDPDSNNEKPTFTEVKTVNIPHSFVVKYRDEEQRKVFSDFVIELIKKHELKDFHIEEFKAFEEPRILYNNITLVNGEEINFQELDDQFLRYSQ